MSMILSKIGMQSMLLLICTRSKMDLLLQNIVRILMKSIKLLFDVGYIDVGKVELIIQERWRTLIYIVIVFQLKQTVHGKWAFILAKMLISYALPNSIIFIIINVIQ